MKKYDNETRARWGNTDAYREHEQKTKNYTKEKWTEANYGMMEIFAEFAALKTSGEPLIFVLCKYNTSVDVEGNLIPSFTNFN